MFEFFDETSVTFYFIKGSVTIAASGFVKLFSSMMKKDIKNCISENF